MAFCLSWKGVEHDLGGDDQPLNAVDDGGGGLESGDSRWWLNLQQKQKEPALGQGSY